MLGGLTTLAWIGLLALLFLILAISIVTFKGLVPPKKRLKFHKTFALMGVALVILHGILGLSRFF